MVTVKLTGADLELFRAGKADGQATGIQEVVDGLEQAFAEWKDRVLEERPESKDEVTGFLQGVSQHLAAWRDRATQYEAEKMPALRRAFEAGAGQPRRRKLLDQVRGAIVGGVAGWRGR